MDDAHLNGLWPALAVELLVPVVVALATAAAAWIVARLPGPLRDALQSGTHQRDVALVVETMARRALAVRSGHADPQAIKALDVVDYARKTLPEVLAKLSPRDEALLTMAQAALAKAAPLAADSRNGAVFFRPGIPPDP